MPEKSDNILGSMPVGRLVVHMSWPIMLSMLMQAVYNLVDSIYVTRVSENAFLALSYAYPVQSLMVAFCVGTGVGFSALLAKRLGQGDQRQANSAVFHGLLLYLGCWILFLLFGLFACRAYMDFCTDTAQVAEMGVEYLRICCCFSFSRDAVILAGWNACFFAVIPEDLVPFADLKGNLLTHVQGKSPFSGKMDWNDQFVFLLWKPALYQRYRIIFKRSLVICCQI